jgi:TolA-binding protein
MTHPRKALVPVLLALLCLAPRPLPAQSSSPSSALKDGIDLFRNGQFEQAIPLFRNVLSDSSAAALKPEAYLLIAKSYIAVGKLDEAEHNLEYYIANYTRSPDFPEALYQKGRLLFLQEDFEDSLQAMQGFLSAYPKSPFVPSAWFWVGESLYGLGRLDEALAVYRKILTDYPSSVKVEAAQYKVALVQVKRKEVELSRLLKWSHEDFLRSLEEFQTRERTYQQAIEAYQKRLAGTGAIEDQKTLAELRQALAAKTEEARRLEAQLSAAGGAPSTTPATQQPPDQQAKLQRLLAAQQKALALKELYLGWLDMNGGAGK